MIPVQFLASSGHQHPWYWPWRIGKFLSSLVIRPGVPFCHCISPCCVWYPIRSQPRCPQSPHPWPRAVFDLIFGTPLMPFGGPPCRRPLSGRPLTGWAISRGCGEAGCSRYPQQGETYETGWVQWWHRCQKDLDNKTEKEIQERG